MIVLNTIQTVILILPNNLSSFRLSTTPISLLLFLFAADAYEANIGKLQVIETLSYKFAFEAERR